MLKSFGHCMFYENKNIRISYNLNEKNNNFYLALFCIKVQWKPKSLKKNFYISVKLSVK